MVRSIVILFCVLVLSGCVPEYNIATRQEELLYYSTDKEVRIGRAIAQKIKKDFEFTQDPLVQHRVETIGKKIVAVCDRQDISYYFFVLDDDEMNAFALPGGYIYLNKGLVDRADNDDEIAAVLAHEVSHVVARHSVKKLQAVMGYSFMRFLMSNVPVKGTGSVLTGADIAFMEILSGYSREDELLADQLGTRYLRSAGYNPRAMFSLLSKLQEYHRRQPLRQKAYFKSHPYVPDRVRIVKQELGEDVTFEDYINIEQMPHGQ